MSAEATSKSKRVWLLVKESSLRYSRHNGARMAAALSYYTIFSLAPLLMIATAVAGFFFGEAAVKGELYLQLRQMFGEDSAKFIQQMVAGIQLQGGNTLAMTIGLGVLFYGACRLFVQLQDSLNTVWGIRPQRGALMQIVRGHLFSFAMILAIGVLLLVMLVFSAVLSGVHRLFESTPYSPLLLRGTDLLVTFSISTVLFAGIFKFLPETRVHWRDVWTGSLITALLFSIGRILIGLYLGRATVTSIFGAAGTLIVLLIWFNYLWQILLFGAEITRAVAEQRRS
jgi:membrane protein